MIDKDKIAELRRLEADQIQETVARHLCKLMDDEWGLGHKLYMDTAKEILDDIALPELLKALEAYQQLYGPKPVVSGSISSALPPHGGVDVG